MSVDLRNNTMFARISLVFQDDCLVKLEHGRMQDRVRRYMYDAIEGVIFWRRIPWVQIILSSLFLLLPGVGMLFANDPFLTGLGIFLAALGGGLVLWYLYVRKTTIRIVRAGKTDDIVGMFRPGKLRKFRNRLVFGIQQAQQAAAARATVETPPLVAANSVPPPLELTEGTAESAAPS